MHFRVIFYEYYRALGLGMGEGQSSESVSRGDSGPTYK